MAVHRFLLVCVPLLCLVAANSNNRVVVERVPGDLAHALSQIGFRKGGRASPTQPVSIKVALRQRNLAELEQVFWNVSDPDHPMYGKHWSIEAIKSLVAPSTACQDAVVDWLTGAGMSADQVRFNAYGDYVDVDTEAAVVEKMLQTELFEYTHPRRSTPCFRTTEGYTIPRSLGNCVDMVHGVISFPHVRKMRTVAHPTEKCPIPQSQPVSRPPAATAAASPSWPNDDCPTVCPLKSYMTWITPGVLRAAYNVTDATFVKGTNSSMAIANPGGDNDAYINPKDLEDFIVGCGGSKEDGQISKYMGGKNHPDQCTKGDRDNCGEASGDTQTSKGISPEIPLQMWIFDSGMYLDWATMVAAAEDAALVHSISAGDPELQSFAGSPSYQKKVSVELQKLGVRGRTCMFSSGDSGASMGFKKLQLSFPSSTPYATAVGGTRFIKDGDIFSGEKGWSGGGGGFSWIFERPSYQEDIVKSYLNSGVRLPPNDTWHYTGRGTPDVAINVGGLQNYNYCIWRNNCTWNFGDTSASSPAFASMVARLNSVRMSNGKSPLGFVNPWLYKVAKEAPNAFHDITEGQNSCFGNNCFFEDEDVDSDSDKGFYCRAGWDPVSGLGTPNLEELAKHL